MDPGPQPAFSGTILPQLSLPVSVLLSLSWVPGTWSPLAVPGPCPPYAVGPEERVNLIPKSSSKSPYAEYTSLSVEFLFWFASLFSPFALWGFRTSHPKMCSCGMRIILS